VRFHRFCRCLGLAATLLIAGSAAVQANPPRGAERLQHLDPQTITFLLGNVQFILLHELAHLVIHEKNVPIIGPEEHAADYVAATVLILGERLDEQERERAVAYLLAAAEAFSLAWDMGSDLGREVRYWGAHALSIQRYHQIVCLLFGSHPETFNELPARVGMPNESKIGCSTEFERAAKSTQWLVSEFGRAPGEPLGAPVRIHYEQPDTLVSMRVVEELRAAGILENTMRRFQDRFALDEPVGVSVRRCRRPESAWVPEDRELVICHELLESIYQLSLRRPAETQLRSRH
jgi:hypothetical protein